MSNGWLTPKFDEIPTLLQDHPRWVLWALDGNGKKAPRSVAKPDRNTKPNKSENWAPYARTIDGANKFNLGVGFVLGHVQDGPTFSGIDLDQCRDPTTGVIEEWARKIISHVNSYTEISPSGKGVKIFVLGSLPPEARQGKVYKMEIYDHDRYFTVTGHRVPGTPQGVEPRESILRDLHSAAHSKDLLQLIRIFGFYHSGSTQDEWIYMRCPWADHHTSGDQKQDAALHLTNGAVDGFKCLHAGCSEKHLADVRKIFGLAGANIHDFITDDHGNILKDNQENIRRALTLLGVKLDHNVFEDKMYMSTAEGRRVMNDSAITRLYLVTDETYKFRPSWEFFLKVIEDHARSQPFHPVLNYLNSLAWDGQKRLERWLVTYGGAADSELTRVIGAKVLVAAVRRVRKPGCKFDEMMVLESEKQGTLKSSALAAICPEEGWFSDDLPLNVDAKQIIERTSGKWIIEASDLSGMRKSDVEHLKATLSRTTDGPVRMAYGHFSEERARSFILIGTTNSAAYLKDMTGNRRFWPVQVHAFDIAGLQRDRDQLWAEASVREAEGESIRLDPKYYDEMGFAQEARRITDAWEDQLLDSDIDWSVGRIPVSDVWAVLQVTNFHNPGLADRLYGIMQKLGYPLKHRVRFNGRVQHCWIRRDVAESLGFTLTPEGGRPDFIPKVDDVS